MAVDPAAPVDHVTIGSVPGHIRDSRSSVIGTNGIGTAYEGTDTPTNQPDDATALSNIAADRGRLWLDDNFDPPKLKRWDGSAFTEVVSGNGEADGSAVFNTTMTAAETFQDLDLSSYVGANLALVHLEVAIAASGGANYYVAKPKGYGSATFTQHYAAGTAAHGGCVTSTDASSTVYTYITVMTDSSGVISHGYTFSTVSITIKLVGYLRMG